MLLLPFVVFPSTAFSVGPDFEECAQKEKDRRADPRGDFTQYSFKSVEEALKDPESFWKFITAPETPYVERRAAAVRAMTVLPFSEVPAKWIPRLLLAQDELETMGRMYFGMTPPPCWHIAYFPGRANVTGKLTVLGNTWEPPEERTPYPLTLDEEILAPWPWQVQEALKDVSSAIYSELGKPGRTDELLQGVMGLPVNTDEQAKLFVRITHYFSMHHKTIPVLRRWRAIGSDPQKPSAAKVVAREIGNDMRMRAMYSDPVECRRLGDAIIIDILKNSRDPEIFFMAANSYHDLHHVEVYEKSQGKVIPESPTAINLITEAVLDPKMGDDWSRVYYYALFLTDLLTDPPFLYAEIKDHVQETGELKKDLEKIRAWYDTHKAELVDASQKEAGELDQVRALLKE